MEAAALTVANAARSAVDAALSAADAAMLGYAVKLTRHPHGIEAGDVEVLRKHGFDDTAIHDIAHVTSYYNYVNRMADGLGVELEEFWEDSDLVLAREEFEQNVGRDEAT